MRPTKILVFDLETIPDLELARKMHPDWRELEDVSVRAKLASEAMEKTGGRSDFLNPPYHKIVAIGCLLADIIWQDNTPTVVMKKLGCVGEEGDDEKTLLEKFIEFFGKGDFLLVSFNGVQFDMPVIRLRAMAHSLPSAKLFHIQNKWENFFQNAQQFHEDLMLMLSGRGYLNLNEISKLLGLPGKLDTDGSWVADLHADGQMKKIRDYCETDVLNTYLLYLHYKHLTGFLSWEAFHREQHHILDYCISEAEDNSRTHLQEFADHWETRERVETSTQEEETPEKDPTHG